MIAPKKREELFDKVLEIVKSFHYIIVNPDEIDKTLLSETSNLNWLEADKSSEIINKIKPNKVIVDCPSTNLEAYRDYIAKNVNTEVIVEHKADLNHLVVGAASIIAKVIRDKEIEKLKKEIGINFGSGYPSDPLTKKFLEEYWESKPNLFRKTWSSYKVKVNNAKQTKLF